MRGESPTRFADRVFSTLAARQHGVVARWQLLKAGVSARQIDLRLDDDRLHQVHRGVYLVGSVARPPHANEMAALLTLRLDATLSHRTATNLWSLLSYPATAQVWLTTSPGRGSRRPGLKVVQAPLTHRDVCRRHSMPLTSPPRTILDMATLLDGEELESLVAEAGYRNLASEGGATGPARAQPTPSRRGRSPRRPRPARRPASHALPGRARSASPPSRGRHHRLRGQPARPRLRGGLLLASARVRDRVGRLRRPQGPRGLRARPPQVGDPEVDRRRCDAADSATCSRCSGYQPLAYPRGAAAGRGLKPGGAGAAPPAPRPIEPAGLPIGCET